MDEPTQDESFEILRGLRDKYEAHHRVRITDEALRSAVRPRRSELSTKDKPKVSRG